MRVLRGLRTVHLVALTLVLAALLTPFAWAGGGPAGYVVVYDPTDIRYRFETTINLVSNNWTEIWTSATNPYPSGAPSYQQIITINPAGLTNSFYRLRISRP